MPATPSSPATYTGNHHIIWSVPDWQQATLGRWRIGTYVPVDESTVMIFKQSLDDQDDYTEFDLMTVAGNPLGLPLQDPTDGHFGIALGLDGLGRINVSGNTHNDPVRCMTSTNPMDITAWTDTRTAVGALLDTDIGWNDTTYQKYCSLMDGTLLWWMPRGRNPGGTPVDGRDIVQLRRGPAATSWTMDGNVYHAESDVTPAPAGEAVRVYQFGQYVVDDGSTFGHLYIGAGYVNIIEVGQPFKRPTILRSDDGGATYESLNELMPTVVPGVNPMTYGQAQLAGGLDRDQNILGNGIAVPHGYVPMMLHNDESDGYVQHWWYPGYGWDSVAMEEPGFSCPTIHQLGSTDRVFTLTSTNSRPYRVKVRFVDVSNPESPSFASLAEFYLGDIMPNNNTPNPMPDPIALREGRIEVLVMDGDIPKVFGVGDGWGWRF